MTAVVMEMSMKGPDDGFGPVRRPQLGPQTSSCQDIINLSDLLFSNDETWLYENPAPPETNLKTWLYGCDDDPVVERLVPKNIDTRTFTRPKKRFIRPSIEKYNEELYGNDLKELSDSRIQINGDREIARPLHFDLEQSTASTYFENILATAPMNDSFQNMSPPSLVNSMCSSTFANLMESSFIKNDPVLREIRDTDYTGSILQQETEPMFQSITESCSSLSSDVPEQFLKKVSFDEKNESLHTTVVVSAGNTTFTQEKDNLTFVMEEEVSSGESTLVNRSNGQEAKAANVTFVPTAPLALNSTFLKRKNKSEETLTPNESILNSTFQRRKNKSHEETFSVNSTIAKKSRDDRTIENVKRLLDRRPSPSLDLNRLSYVVDEKDPIKAAFEIPKRNSFGSTDSGENLDYMSLSSGSSKSSKRQSIDGINMIVDFHEPKGTFGKPPTLQQVMSTPKCKKVEKLWLKEISPIGDRNSDPELSSNELAPTVISMPMPIRKQKSTGQIYRGLSPKGQTTSAIRGSHPSLRAPEPKSKPSNLNSMGHALKGSYTSLRPTNANLPVAPPPLDATVTVAQIPANSRDAQFTKPQPPKSGLPRPMTGIPRPVSRIPAPKRPVSKSAGQQGRY